MPFRTCAKCQIRPATNCRCNWGVYCKECSPHKFDKSTKEMMDEAIAELAEKMIEKITDDVLGRIKGDQGP